MKKRIIWKMFLLEIITFGIYRLYWFIKTRKEMMIANPAIKIKSPAYLLLPFLLIPVVVLFVVITSISSASSRTSNPSCTEYYPNSNSSSYNGYSSSNTSGTNSDLNRQCDENNKSDSSAMELIVPIFLYGGFIVSFFLFVVWIWSYAKGVDVITEGKISFALGLVVLILVPDGIDILIIQEYFNKVDVKTPQLPQQPVKASETPGIS